MAEIPLIGGPSDGLVLRTGLSEAFLWVKGERAYRVARKGASLYERRGGAAFAVGDLTTQCVCGAYRRKHRACPFCGSTETVTV